MNQYTKIKTAIMVMILASLACGATVPTPPAERARTAERPLLAEPFQSETPTVTIGFAVAESVYVRESADLSAPVLGYLTLGAVVLPLECVTVEDITWVRHQEGWTVARNRSAEYITGVCHGN